MLFLPQLSECVIILRATLTSRSFLVTNTDLSLLESVNRKWLSSGDHFSFKWIKLKCFDNANTKFRHQLGTQHWAVDVSAIINDSFTNRKMNTESFLLPGRNIMRTYPVKKLKLSVSRVIVSYCVIKKHVQSRIFFCLFIFFTHILYILPLCCSKKVRNVIDSH